MLNQTQIKKLQSTQNKCVKILNKIKVTNKDYATLKFLKVKDLIKLEQLKFAYKFNKDLLPKKIKECIYTDHKGNLMTKRHDYNTTKKKDYQINQKQKIDNMLIVSCVKA